MKSTKYIILAFIAIVLCGCTRNDGDIGKLFGLWKLTSMERNGNNVPGYEGNIYWAFQNTTVEMKEVTAHHVVYQTFGNFRVEDNTMFFSFPDPDFKPNHLTGLPRECELQIIKLTGGELILSYGDPATVYTFRKW